MTCDNCTRINDTGYLREKCVNLLSCFLPTTLPTGVCHHAGLPYQLMKAGQHLGVDLGVNLPSLTGTVGLSSLAVDVKY